MPSMSAYKPKRTWRLRREMSAIDPPETSSERSLPNTYMEQARSFYLQQHALFGKKLPLPAHRGTFQPTTLSVHSTGPKYECRL